MVMRQPLASSVVLSHQQHVAARASEQVADGIAVCVASIEDHKPRLEPIDLSKKRRCIRWRSSQSDISPVRRGKAFGNLLHGLNVRL